MTRVLLIIDEAPERHLCQAVLASSPTGFDARHVDGAVALADAMAEGEFEAAVIDVNLRFAPAPDVAELIHRHTPLSPALFIALGGSLPGATSQIERTAAGYMRLPTLLAQALNGPTEAILNRDSARRLAQALGLGLVILDREDRIEEWNSVARKHLGEAIDPKVGFWSEPVQWNGDVGSIGEATLDGRPAHIAVLRSAASRVFLFSPTARLPNAQPDASMLMAHDLKAPLRTIRRYSRLLSSRLASETDTDTGELLRTLTDAAAQAENQVRRIFGHRVSLAPENLSDANEAVQRSCMSLSSLIDDTAATIEAGNLPMLEIGLPELTTVLQNLIENALKYRSNAAPHVEVTATQRGDAWLIGVQDNGVGIAGVETGRIFEMFARGTSSSGVAGTGIGLAVCKGIIERNGGQIWAESDGSGTQVVFTVPAHRWRSQPASNESNDDLIDRFVNEHDDAFPHSSSLLRDRERVGVSTDPNAGRTPS